MLVCVQLCRYVSIPISMQDFFSMIIMVWKSENSFLLLYITMILMYVKLQDGHQIDNKAKQKDNKTE